MKRLMRIFCFIGLAGMALVGCQTGGGGGSIDTTLDAGATTFTTGELYNYFADQTQVRDGGGVYYSDFGTLVLLEDGEKHEGTWASFDGGKLCRNIDDQEEPACEIYYHNGDAVAVVMGEKTIQAPKLIKGDQIELLATGSARKLYTKEQTIALVSGKTHAWENYNGAYYSPDGKLYTLWDGEKEIGKWSVNDEGGLCWHISSWGSSPCEQYFDSPEGLMSLYKGKEGLADELREGNVLNSL
jgi:hypothetical protein